MKYHKDLDVLLSEDLSTQKDSCLWEEKQEEVAASQVAHIRKPVRLFFTDLVLEKVALAWRLWLQSMSRTVYKEPSPGLIVWDGSEIPQMGDTRRGGSFVSSFFFVWSTCCVLNGHWLIAFTMERQPHSWVKTKHEVYLRGCCTCAAEMGASQIARMHVCTRTLRCYFSLQSSNTDLEYNAMVNCVFLPKKCP